MVENAFYFQHDYNARNNPKILELRARLGEDGTKAYGAFWMLTEAMAESSTTDIDPGKLNGLAFSFGVSAEWLKRFIHECLDIGLLINNGDSVTSERILKHKAERALLKEVRSKGGRASAAKRNNSLTPVEHELNTCSTGVQQNPTKERIGQESKGEDKREDDNTESRRTPLSLFEDDLVDLPNRKDVAKSKKATTKFSPPTEAEVKAYMQERNIPNLDKNVVKFMSHFEGNGWTLGKAGKPMKDWQATIRKWQVEEWLDLSQPTRYAPGGAIAPGTKLSLGGNTGHSTNGEGYCPGGRGLSTGRKIIL